jgi:hypothetical protein
MSIDAEYGQGRAGDELDSALAGRHADADTAMRRRRRRRRWWIAVTGTIALALLAVGVLVLRGRGVPTMRLSVSGVANGPDAWSVWPDPPLRSRFQQLMVATDSGIFVWGGSTDFDIGGLSDGAFFDASARTWRRLPDSPLVADAGNAIGVWTGTEVIVANGRERDVRAAAFDTESFTWRSLPDLPLEQVALSITQIVDIDGTIVVFDRGGGARDNHVLVLDDAGGTWQSGTLPPIGISNSFDAISIGDRAVVAAFEIAGKALDCGQLHLLTYRPASDAWAELPSGPTEHLIFPALAWTGSELLVAGADECEKGNAADSTHIADLFDPVTNTWRAASSAPVGFVTWAPEADAWTGQSFATVEPDGRVVLYNPTSDTWHVGPPSLPSGRSLSGTPVVAFDGSIVISGGSTGSLSDCCTLSVGTYVYQPPAGF